MSTDQSNDNFEPEWSQLVQLVLILLLVFGAVKRDTDILLWVIAVTLIGMWIDAKSAL
jgi:hypothetical protein